MLTMLYDAETLKPQLLISEDIENGDIGEKFWVINGAWGGTFNGDSIVIHHPIYGDSNPVWSTSVTSLNLNHLKNTLSCMNRITQKTFIMELIMKHGLHTLMI